MHLHGTFEHLPPQEHLQSWLEIWKEALYHCSPPMHIPLGSSSIDYFELMDYTINKKTSSENVPSD